MKDPIRSIEATRAPNADSHWYVDFVAVCCFACPLP